MRIVVVGGAGFIGSAICRSLVAGGRASVLNIDKLTPTSSLASLRPIESSSRYGFRKADICDGSRVSALLQAFAPDAIIHAAFDRHGETDGVDAAAAIQSNVIGTCKLLEAARDYWSRLPGRRREDFRFLNVSSAGTARTPADASRLAADELVLAWHKSYGLPAIVSKAAATFGPYQFPHEVVPAAILAASEGATVATDGSGAEVCDWIYVEDHVRALEAMLAKGKPGVSYLVAGTGRLAPDALVQRVARLVERQSQQVRQSLTLGAFRSAAAAEPAETAPDPGPALDTSRIQLDTGWRARETLQTALAGTVRWYLANEVWWRPLSAARAAGNCQGLLRTA